MAKLKLFDSEFYAIEHALETNNPRGARGFWNGINGYVMAHELENGEDNYSKKAKYKLEDLDERIKELEKTEKERMDLASKD